MSYKPSLICSYSAGQWGGARAAVLLRPALSEMGCIPVSAMIHVPKAAEVFDQLHPWRLSEGRALCPPLQLRREEGQDDRDPHAASPASALKSSLSAASGAPSRQKASARGVSPPSLLPVSRWARRAALARAIP